MEMKMTTMHDMFVAYQTHKGFAQQQDLEPIGFKEFTGIFIHFNSTVMHQSVAIYTASKNSEVRKKQTYSSEVDRYAIQLAKETIQ
jgi:hypothetical protein